MPVAFLSVLTVISIAVLNQQSGEIRQQPWEIKGRSCCSVRQVPHTFIAKITYFLRTKSSFPWSKLWEKLGIEGITSSPSHWAQASTPDSLTVSFFVTCSNNQWDFFFFFYFNTLQHTRWLLPQNQQTQHKKRIIAHLGLTNAACLMHSWQVIVGIISIPKLVCRASSSAPLVDTFHSQRGFFPHRRARS